MCRSMVHRALHPHAGGAGAPQRLFRKQLAAVPLRLFDSLHQRRFWQSMSEVAPAVTTRARRNLRRMTSVVSSPLIGSRGNRGHEPLIWCGGARARFRGLTSQRGFLQTNTYICGHSARDTGYRSCGRKPADAGIHGSNWMHRICCL
jgi:hypothetical protein